MIVQTYQPDARPITLAARHDVEEFLAGELERREELGYPPFRHLVRDSRLGAGRRAPTKVLDRAGRRAVRAGAEADLLGPAPLLRLRGRHRAQLLAKTDAPRGAWPPTRPACSPPRARDAARRARGLASTWSPQGLFLGFHALLRGDNLPYNA